MNKSKFRKRFIACLLILALSFPIIKLNTNRVVSASSNGQQEITYKGSGYDVKFQITSSWSGAFNANVTIQNTSDEVIDNWAIGFEMPYKITNIWNGVIKEKKNGHYIIKNAGSNQDIAVGQSVSFGFSAKSDILPLVPDSYDLLCIEENVANDKIEISFKVTNDWDAAFNGEILIKNISNSTIEDWKLQFDFEAKINRFWTAEILEHQGNHYYIKNVGYNSNIKPGETIQLGFSASQGGNIKEPTSYQLSQIIQNTDDNQENNIDREMKDTDEDGLADELEKEIGTDYQKADTDGDELPDGYEYYTLGTNPIKNDTDGNGIIDNKEDYDKDKLSNYDEYKDGTDPKSEDTDEDGLSDYEEIYVYHTNPVLEDTDVDGIIDGDEIKLGLNPLSKYSKEDILDSEVILEQSISSEKLDFINKINPYSISINVNSAGVADSSLHVEVSNNIKVLKDNDFLLGDVISFQYDDLQFEEMVITYKIDSDCVTSGTRNYPNEKGLEGVKKYQVFCYDSKLKALYPVETKFDTQNNTVSIMTNKLGDYCVIDMDSWLNEMGVENDEKVNKNSSYENADIVMKNNSKKFSAVTPVDLCEITLSKTPSKNDTSTNDDGDKLPNSNEIDWSLINTKNGTIQLPTLRQYWEVLNSFQQNTFSRFNDEFSKKIDEIRVLPLKSNPTKTDTDGDEYNDDIDPSPLYNDVTYYYLKFHDTRSNYVPVRNSGNDSYAGNQGWFSDKNWFSTDYILRNYGCGTIAAGDLFLYLALQKRANTVSTDTYLDGKSYINKKDYKNYINWINSRYTETMRFTGVIGSKLEVAINHYIKQETKLKLSASWKYSLTYKSMLNNLKKMMNNDLPAIISIGLNSQKLWSDTGIHFYDQTKTKVKGQLYKYEEVREKINGHYVTVTGIIIDNNVKNANQKIMLEISSWGKKFYVSYIEYRDFIKNNGDKWTSSMVYLH